jgi:hypothetical protein
MKERIANYNVSGVPENTQDSPMGLKNDEVHNLNNEAQQPPPADAEKISSFVEGVASETSPTQGIIRPWIGTGAPPVGADPGEDNLVVCAEDEDESYFEMRSPEEIFRAAHELDEKVWYYRKLNLLVRVERGEEPIPPDDIANRMFAEMRRMEQQYGKENLGPFDDWEWGYLNGKLSAIRWVLGLQWDDLDT